MILKAKRRRGGVVFEKVFRRKLLARQTTGAMQIEREREGCRSSLE